ncbi:MAG: polymerase sigma factor RpoE [Pseudomonadota bacterium]
MSPAEFEAEFLPNVASLLAVANRLAGTRSEAEDLVQDTLLKAFRSREQYRTGTNPRAWLLAILRNTFLNGYRRRSLERKVFDGPDGDALAAGWVGASSLRGTRDPHSGALHHLLEAPLLQAIDELPPEFKMTVMLADIEQLSYREIADSMNCPIGTVMSRLHRGRRWLRAQLLEHARAIGLTGDEELATEPAASRSTLNSKEAASKPAASKPAASKESHKDSTAGAGESVAPERVSSAPVELEQYRRARGGR